MDALSDLLAVASVRGSLFSRAELTAPWGVSTRGAEAAIFHVIVEGSGWVEVEGGGPAQPFRSGDLLLMPHGTSHVLRDQPSSLARAIRELPSQSGPDGLPCIRHGGGGPRTSILCGTFRFGADGGGFLLPLLPRLIHARGGSSATAAWMDSTLRMLADETARAESGSALLISRLAEVLFIQVLRAWAQEAHEERRGLFGALTDPRLAQALGLIHREPARAWSVPMLAARVGMSRSAFFERFHQALDETPVAYLTRWRMVLARSALRKPDTSLTEVAERVGYASEAAFSRAFKRETGASPAHWRRQARQEVEAHRSA